MPQERRSRIGNGFVARLMADSALIEKGGTPGLDRGAPPLLFAQHEHSLIGASP